MENKLGLMDQVDGVPFAHRPAFWDIEQPVSYNLDLIGEWCEWYSSRADLFPYGGGVVPIDEAAILVPTTYHRDKLMRQLSDAGWEMFNEAQDLVFTNPFSTRYLVRYLFFRHGDYPFRLEVMMTDHGLNGSMNGFSPLHAALWNEGRPNMNAGAHRFPIPHLSYKPRREIVRLPAQVMAEAGLVASASLETPGRAFAREVDRLRGKGFIHAQTCQSTYGMFGYYIHQDADRQIYLKPRVNLRDEG